MPSANPPALARGYHAATLDEIADEAGFPRGVVQSRFGNKADLFLALLEERIDERAAQNARLAEGLSGAEGTRMLREHAARRNRAELDWGPNLPGMSCDPAIGTAPAVAPAAASPGDDQRRRPDHHRRALSPDRNAPRQLAHARHHPETGHLLGARTGTLLRTLNHMPVHSQQELLISRSAR